jgi:NTP pyrophosphatase (non-canonical NTP hydrolase)
MSALSFDDLRAANVSRRGRWHGPETVPWTGADWGNAMGGEAGEAQNVVKKLRRIETGMPNDHDGAEPKLLEDLGDELADTIIYADLLAQHYGIDLADAIARKFNAVSLREGYPERLPRRNETGVRCCRVCGCTEDNACPPTSWWVEPDLCSTCESGRLLAGAPPPS